MSVKATILGRELVLAPTRATFDHRANPLDPVDFLVTNPGESVGPVLFQFHPGSGRLQYDDGDLKALLMAVQKKVAIADLAGGASVGMLKGIRKATRVGFWASIVGMLFATSEFGFLAAILSWVIVGAALIFAAILLQYVVILGLPVLIYRVWQGIKRKKAKAALIEAAEALAAELKPKLLAA